MFAKRSLQGQKNCGDSALICNQTKPPDDKQLKSKLLTLEQRMNR